MPWYLGTVMASASLALSNTLKRSFGVSFYMVLLQIFLTSIIVAGYWYGFQKAPKFINCWFLGTALNSLSAIILGVLFFDKLLSAQSITAIVLIVIASCLLV